MWRFNTSASVDGKSAVKLLYFALFRIEKK
jgi:hypothetical protein